MEKFMVSYDFLIIYALFSIGVGLLAGIIIGQVIKSRNQEISEIKLRNYEEELEDLKEQIIFMQEEARQYARSTNDVQHPE